MKEVFEEIWEGMPMPARYLMFFGLGMMLTCFAWITTSCSTFKSYRPDNALEEVTEEMIEKYTGLDVDLSPSSPE